MQSALLAAEAIGAGSFLGQLPAAARERLMADATRLALPAGRVIFAAADPRPRMGVMGAGLARAYLEGPLGRRLTVRYAAVGALIGNTSGPVAARAPLSVAAVEDCVVWELDVELLRALGAADGRVAWAFADELILRLQDAHATVAANCFGSMPERVARQLLDHAADDPAGEQLVARVTHQQLAEDLGTVREVVSRTLASLRAAGLVETGVSEIVILDPERLAALGGRWR
ncbi:MAG: Crp/Fnr family transcriptional regulator [Candidatus Limnocylindrales bacterium]